MKISKFEFGVPPSLRNVTFRQYEGAQWLSSVGDQAQALAISLLVFQETRSVWYLTIAFWIMQASSFAGTLPGGRLADKLPRNYLLRAEVGAQAAVSAGLCVMASLGVATIVVLLIAQAIAGLLDGMIRSAEPSLVSEIVSRETYRSARYVNTVQAQSGALLGSAAVAPLVALHLNLAWAFGMNSASFWALLYLLLFRLEQGRERPIAQGEKAPIREAVKYLWQDKEARVALGLYGWTAVCTNNGAVMLILIAERLLGGEHAYPMLVLANALGILAIGTLQACRKGEGRTSMMTFAVMGVVCTAFGVPYGVSHWLVISMASIAIASVGGAYIGIAVGVLIVQHAENHLMGRLNGIYQMIQRAATGLSISLAALMVTHLGVSVTMIVTKGVGLLWPGLLLCILTLRRWRRLCRTNPGRLLDFMAAYQGRSPFLLVLRTQISSSSSLLQIL